MVTKVCRWFDGTLHGRRERGQDDLPALPSHFRHAVAVLLAQVGDVRPAGLEDHQTEQPEHGHQREVVAVGRGTGGGEQDLELQVRQPEGR
ncbi:hypothetical protein V5H98_04950 [Georgenia sp. M64]|uniref:hypothetical protein n=1 Tax=Georgenia sp. M64 TaxID=3120520 RepID=UPI0030E46718